MENEQLAIEMYVKSNSGTNSEHVVLQYTMQMSGCVRLANAETKDC